MKERRNAGYLWSRILPSVFSLRMRRSARGASNRIASWSITPRGSGASTRLISGISPTWFGGRLFTSEFNSKNLLFAGRANDPLFIPQIAACVRFWTRILRRIALTWTFTVASAIFLSSDSGN